MKKKKYHLTEIQLYNVGLAFRKKSDCPAAKGLVKKLDHKFNKKHKKK